MSSSSSSSEDDIFLINLISEVEAEQEKKRKRIWVHDINVKRPVFGEFHHLFPDLQKDKKKFFKAFRMCEDKFFELLNLITPEIEKQNTKFREAVTCAERLAVTLRFLGTGDSFETIARSYRLGDSTVRSIVYEACEAIWSEVRPIVMPEPDQERWEQIEDGFRQKWQFPNCVGAIDGKHVLFQKPRNSGTKYFNYKQTCSIVLLAVVDASYKFTLIDVGAYGKNSDGGIFANCVYGKKFLRDELGFPPDKPLPDLPTVPMPYVFVGDEAFPLHKKMMRPYPSDQLSNEHKKIFNYRLSRARNVSEDAFGIMCKKFRFYQRRMETTPEHLELIVSAACCLHNFLRGDSEALFAEVVAKEGSLPDANPLQNFVGVGGSSPATALLVREKFTEYFNSEAGSVAWQTSYVRRGRLDRNVAL